MKRSSVAFVALALLAAPVVAHAQFGIKAGVAFGNISNKGVLPGDLKGRSGFAGGLSLESAPALIGFGVEGLFSQEGLTSAATESSLKLSYISVPAYLRVMIPTPAIKPFAYLGPQVSFEVKCDNGSGDCGGDHKKTVFAGVIGAGVRFGGSTSTGFSVEGRYVYGLTDLNPSTVTSSESYKTRTFLLLAGFHF
ncbi:MAG: porin family protein [Gemmatimonadota bacterium]